ncbi:MAG: NADH-quinone oxidoreductase subunit L [Humibacillus sp.]|nr:NADH-quinone oxidoreductase subunit L [Humibacillus sp.]MDN5778383.1 NADH-quinone oxidoreductase subunit L [Humibacillus sp.]
MIWVVRLVVLLPALAGLAGLLARRTPLVARGVAVGSAVVVVALAVALFVAPMDTADIDSVGALPLGNLSAPLHLLSDQLSGVVALVVSLVVLTIQVFTVWYLRDDPRYTQFAATVSLFAAGMLLVVASADLALTLVGWEVMGWCSWLLIGHDSERFAARRAAYKAFLVTCVADIAMVVGFIALSVRARSTDLLDVLTVHPSAGTDALLTLGLVCVVIGVAGKSGLVPFHDWLPDAMEGPTPASALIHAATMVAAGTYVIARLFPLYAFDDAARTVLAVLAAVTMVYTALLAFAQTDLKRLLAYSTLSQVAIMLGALAAAPADVGPVPAVSHLVGHAFFKALLFLGAGWLAALVGATALDALRGRARDRRALRRAMAIGLASLAGVPPLIGFFTKDTAIDAAVEGATGGGGLRAWIVVVALFATTALTAAYCTRAWLLLDTPCPTPASTSSAANDSFEVEHGGTRARSLTTSAFDDGMPLTPLAVGEPGVLTTHGEHKPITLTASLSVFALAALTLFGTLLLLGLDGAVHVGVVSATVSLLFVAAGAFAAWSMSERGLRDAAERLPTRLRADAVIGFGADTAYARVGSGVTALARLVVVLDRDVVDAYPRATAVTARQLGRIGVRLHRAVPASALLGVVVGIVVVAVLGVTVWQ